MKHIPFRLLLAGLLLAGQVAPAHAGGDAGRSGKEDAREWRADHDGKRSPKPGDEVGRRSVMRPGSYLSPAFSGVQITDHQRYRLRPPPRGFAWFRAGRAFVLVSLSDGQVFDIVE
jgi:Ni/Co efflux regulator RcnB